MAEVILNLAIPGEPIPKARPRIGTSGGITPARTAAAQRRIGWEVKAALAEKGLGLPMGGPFLVKLKFWSCWEEADGRSADLDNLVKLVCDGLNNVVWFDDRQVRGIEAEIVRGAKVAATAIVIARL